MEEVLRRLLNELSQIGNTHVELFDSECRECMSRAIYDGFLMAKPDKEIAGAFGMSTEEGNQAVREALARYVSAANEKANYLGIHRFRDRLNSFQNEHVKSDDDGNYYDDFFGSWRTSEFDDDGNRSHSPENR